MFYKGNRFAFREGSSVKIDFSPFQKGSTHKGKNLLLLVFWASVSKCFLFPKGSALESKEFSPLGSKFFPFRVNPISKGPWHVGKQTGSHKPLVKKVQNLQTVSRSFNPCHAE